MHKIKGVDHVGIGVKDFTGMKSFYRDILGFTRIFGEMPEEDHPPIQPLIRTAPALHSAIQIQQEAGGLAVALFHAVKPVPRPIRKDFRYGDIGINKTTIAVSGIEEFYKNLQGKIKFCTKPKSIKIPGWGDYNFVYAKDPEGNLIEFVSGPKFETQGQFGGVRWIGISVTELERSREFYQRHLGFDQVLIETHELFSGAVDELTGFKTKVRSCVISNGTANGAVELIELVQPRGRSIPFGVNWGDWGYLQLCLLGTNIKDTEVYYTEADMDFMLKPQAIDDPEHAGLAFLYVRDPDGIPVETMTLPG